MHLDDNIHYTLPFDLILPFAFRTTVYLRIIYSCTCHTSVHVTMIRTHHPHTTQSLTHHHALTHGIVYILEQSKKQTNLKSPETHSNAESVYITCNINNGSDRADIAESEWSICNGHLTNGNDSDIRFKMVKKRKLNGTMCHCLAQHTNAIFSILHIIVARK